MALIDPLTARNRARTYALLAEVFGAEPTEEKTTELCNVADALGLRCPDRPPLDDVRREFMNLFVVPNARYVAPYESAYRDDRPNPASRNGRGRAGGLLMGDSTLAVRQAFLDVGVLPSGELPDHIANELRLVSHLWHVQAYAGGEAAGEAARRRDRFVSQHLLQWIEDLGGTIARNSQTGFYRTAVEAVLALLKAEPTPAGPEYASSDALPT